MDRPILSSLLLLLVLVSATALTAPQSQTHQRLHPALLQTQSRQQPDPNGPTIFYIRDRDEAEEVAVDYGDTVDYARSTLVIQPNPQSPEVPASAFMTGDVFDNDFSDESKLEIGVFRAPSSPLLPFDSDEVAMAPQEPPDVDEDVLAVSAPVEEMEGDMDDDRWNPISNMRVTSRQKTEESLDWGEYITVDDSDEWTADEVDTQVYIDDSGEVPIPAQRIRTSEMVFDLDEEEIQTAGIRYIQRDLNGVPVYYGTDSQGDMEGDMYDNKRSDQRPLIVTAQTPTNPLVWAQPASPPPPPPFVEALSEPDIDEIEQEYPDIVQVEDVDDLTEIDTVFEPIDMEIRDEDHGGDLDEVLAFDQSDFMVGDLFDNQRTDEFKLTIVGNRGEANWPVDQDQDEELAIIEQTPEPEPVREELLYMDEDVDDLDNLFVTPAEIFPDIDEVIIPEQAIIAATVRRDADELDYTSPLSYMSGDLYDNKRTDTSLLRVNELRGQAITWPQVDSDEETIYQVEASRPIVDSDEVLTTTYQVEYQRVLDQDDLPEALEPTQEANSLISGNRRVYEDEDDVPAFYSSDPADYITGDLFDNDRSDNSRLTLVLQGGAAAAWRGDYDESRNPGFLP